MIHRLPLCLLLLGTIKSSTGLWVIPGMIPCSNDAECVSETRPGSTCTAEKFCSSPYANGGCLANRLTNWTNPTTIVETLHCQSKDWSHWWTIFAGWQALILLIAAVLAYQSRGMREDVVETKTLAMMIYNHILFLVLRTTTFILQAQDSTEDQLTLQWIRSILNSADVLMTLSIYFLPKFFLQPVRRRGSEGSFDTLQGGWQDTTFRRRVVEESSDGGGIPISFDTSGSKRSSSGKSKSRNSSSTPDVLQSTQENVMESGGARSQGQSYNSEGSSAGLTTHTDVGTHSVESDADARVDDSRAK